MNASNYFVLISDPTEKMKLLNDLADSHREILCKSVAHNAVPFICDAVAMVGSYLTVRPKKLGVLPVDDNNLIVQFQLGNQKYITQVEFKRNEDLVALSMSKKLFRVQRREFFRLKLPKTFRGVLRIDNIGVEKVYQDFKLVDISGGGCKVEVPLEVRLTPGIPFSGTLKLPDREDGKFQCIVRHKSMIDVQPQVQWVGIQFIDSQSQQNKLASLVMDLHRELFSRL